MWAKVVAVEMEIMGKNLGSINQMNVVINSMWERSEGQIQISRFVTEWMMESFAEKKNVGAGTCFLTGWWGSK